MSDSFFEPEAGNQPQGFTLDFKRVISRAVRFWYVIVLSFSISLFVAVYKTRYSQRVYPVSASIVIREVQEAGGANLLYRNSLMSSYRNYLNEPYIIKSYPLIEKVVRDLNFDIAFYSEGYFMTTESYSYLPVKAKWCNPKANKSGKFIFSMVSESTYSLQAFAEEEVEEEGVFTLGDTIDFKGFSIHMARATGRPMKSFLNVPYLMTIQDPTQVAGAYISRLNVAWAEQGAGVINLSINGTNPEKEIDFLNGLVKAYSNLDLEKKNRTAQQTSAFIRTQLSNIKDSLRTVEFQLERFGNSSRIKDMSAEAQRLFAKTEAFQLQQTELLIRKSYYKYLEEYIEKNEAGFDQIILPTSVGLQDPVLLSLLSSLIDLQLDLKIYLDPEKAINPLVTAKLDRIREIKKNVKEALETLKSTDKIKNDFLVAQFDAIEKQLALLPGSERQLIGIQRNYSLLENLYVFLMQKLSEASISEASNTSDIVPVNPAMRGGIISPKPMQNYIIGAMVGLVIPAIIFILFELANTKVQSKEDIEKMTTIPFVGGVGHNEAESNLTVVERPKSVLAESFRSLRSNLNFFTGNQTKRVFMVSSSISGEGKTFTTINLATVFAISGKKTLIVGADMRRPKIFQDFGRSNDQGLSTYLSGIAEFNEVVQTTEIDNLFLISGGPVPPNPSELLLTNKFEEFIKKALEVFDFVLIDTPPLALVTDAFVMSKFVDHTVFVMRQNYSPKEFVKSIDEYYRSGKIKNISILLNDIYKTGLGYGYGQSYAYQYGYGYGAYGGYGYYSDDIKKK